jgi:hypothetical protein
MATRLKPRGTRSISRLGDETKRDIAREITRAIGGPWRVDFEPNADMDYGLFDDDFTSAKGHVWYCEISEIPGENDLKSWVLDDREGDIRKLIGDSLRERAKVLTRWAAQVETVELPGKDGDSR